MPRTIGDRGCDRYHRSTFWASMATATSMPSGACAKAAVELLVLPALFINWFLFVCLFVVVVVVVVFVVGCRE